MGIAVQSDLGMDTIEPSNPSSRSVIAGTLSCAPLIVLGAVLVHGRILATGSPDPVCTKAQMLLALGQGILALLLSRYLNGPKAYLRALGLRESLGTGLGVGLAILAPSILFIFVVGVGSPSDPLWLTFVCKGLIPSLAQELCFRGMLFGFLVRFAGWGFFSVALLCGAAYSLTLDFDGLASVEVRATVFWAVLQTLWLSWLFMKWKWNLWVGIVIQVVFRFTWHLASDGEDHFGGFFKNMHILLMMVWSVAFMVWRDRSRWWTRKA